MTYADRARRYAEHVVSGKIPAAKPTRLACERHLLDMEKQSDDDFDFYFDADAGEKVCRFIEALPHVKGKWALEGMRMELEGWQCFFTCSVFGWKRKKDDLRRFRRVYGEIPRKNGKSQYTAAVGLYMLAADGEYGAEVYSGAGSEKQAWEVFRPARLMAKKTPGLRDTLGIEVNAKNLHILASGSRFEPIIGKPGDGAAPSMAIHDEYHEHPTEEQYDTMLTGMGSREQPLSWVITTAGSDTSSPCYALRSEVMDVLEGTITNDELFGIIYTIDDDVAWDSDEALAMANPNLGVSVFEGFLKARQKEARDDPRKQATFKTKHLNVWVTASSPYFHLGRWTESGDDSLESSEFEGQPCWCGLDLAQKRDLTAYVKVFRRDLDGTDHYYAFGRFYVPEERIHAPENRHYYKWVETGDLIATPGNITDYDEIEADVLRDSERFRIVELGADPYNFTQLGTHLSSHGVNAVEVPQSVPHLSEPMKWVEALIFDRRLHHDGNEVFAWGISNVTAKPDRNDNVFPRKERDERKIDPAVALIIAMRGAMGEEQAGSVYEERGFEVFEF